MRVDPCESWQGVRAHWLLERAILAGFAHRAAVRSSRTLMRWIERSRVREAWLRGKLDAAGVFSAGCRY